MIEFPYFLKKTFYLKFKFSTPVNWDTLFFHIGNLIFSRFLRPRSDQFKYLTFAPGINFKFEMFFFLSI